MEGTTRLLSVILKKLCEVCQGKHLKVLHEVNKRDAVESPKEGGSVDNATTDVLYLDRSSESSRVLLKVIKVLLSHHDRKLVTYAVLDDGLERTMLLPEATRQLGLEGIPEELSLRTIRQDVQVLRGACVSFQLSPAAQQKRSFKITHAFTSPHLNLTERSYPVTSLQKKYKHLVGLPIEQFAQVKPLILIGADNPHLLTPIEPVRLGPPGGPAAIHTRLGWTLQGPARLVQQTLPGQQCLFTTVSPKTTELMANVQKLWQMDVLLFQSDKVVTRLKEDQEAVEMLEAKTRRVEIEGILRYATPLLRKRQMPLFKATKEAVMPSLRCMEKRLARDPQLAEAYCEEIRKLV